MFNKRHTGKKRIITCIIAGTVAVAAICGALYFDYSKSYARTSLSNVEKIREDSAAGNPFVILEVVDDYSDASFGYLVGGEEPVYYQKSIKDMPSKEERTSWMSSYSIGTGSLAESLQNAGAFSYSTYTEPDADGKSMDIRGRWKDAASGDYKDSGASGYVLLTQLVSDRKGDGDTENDIDIYDSSTNTIKYDELNSLGIQLFRKQVVYSEGGGNYVLTLQKLSTDNIPYKLSGGDANFYTWQYFEAHGISTIDDYSVGQYIYKGGDTLTYVGTVVEVGDPAEKKLKDSSGSEVALPDPASDAYCYVVENNSASENVYRVSSSDGTVTAGVYSRTEEYANVPGGEFSESNCPSSSYNDYYYLKDASAALYTYDAGNGTYNFIADYSQDIYQTFTYSGGFDNNEWFKDYVLDLDSDPAKNRGVNRDDALVDVVTIKLSELDSYELEQVDMIYFAGGYKDGSGYDIGYDPAVDISASTAIKIIDKVQNDKMPVIMEKSVLAINDVWSFYGITAKNINGLAIWLMQKDSTYSIDGVEATSSSWSSANLKNGLSWANLFDNMFAGYDYNDDNIADDYSFVNGTVFVNDNTSDKKSVVADDFNTQFNQKKTDGGFSSVIAEIIDENIYIENAGEEPIKEVASKATAIRHIINANDARIVFKSELRVLDLEPYDCTQFGWDSVNYAPTDEGLKTLKTVNKYASTSTETVSTLTMDTFDKSWFIDKIATQFASTTEAKSKISVDMQGTAEFVSKRENLNETYDLIYIGADTTMMNTEYTVNGTKTDKTKFNDSNMNGLVYYHTGDWMLYDDSSVAGDAGRCQSDSNVNRYRMAGNDITYDKYVELSNYIKAGYAVMLSDQLANKIAGDTDPVNWYRVDKSSYMYKLLKEVAFAKDADGNYLYYGKNVNYKSALDNNAQAVVFSKYVNISGLKLTTSKIPTPYVEKDGVGTYLEMNNGQYSLDYTVKLENASQVGSDTKYNVELFIDTDSDGNFESHEKLTGLNVTNTNGDSEGVDGNGRYNLSIGNTYNISRQLPDEYIGFISWKLVFTQNKKNTATADYENSAVKVSTSGFTAVPADASQRPEIKILQIESYATGNSKQEPNGSKTIGNKNQNLDLNSQDIKTLCEGVNDFKVNVTKINVSDYINEKNFYGKTHTEYLCDYDMIVLGFTDVYEFLADNQNSDSQYKKAINGIREYANSGRSVLFTHDLTNSFLQQNGINTASGWYATTFMRDVMGMDRYGVTTNSIAHDSTGIMKDNYNSVYDIAKLKGDTVGNSISYSTSHHTEILNGYTTSNIGYTNFHLVRFHNNSGYSFLNKKISNRDGRLSTGKTVTSDTTVIEQLNAGQITEYPYNINTIVTVKSTHPQYYQLNLDTHADDDVADDVTVWYAISNDSVTNSRGTNNNAAQFAQLVPKDGRNNYYIFSKGNITYTGAGHSLVEGADEKKLFVNTLVAAYRAGTHSPKVLFKENPRDTAATVTRTYMPYDGSYVNPENESEIGAVLDNSITVNFKTVNNNFANSNQALYAKYYVRVDSGTSGAIKIGEKYYKQITPVSFMLADDYGNMTAATASSLGNYKIYSAKFNSADLDIKITGASTDSETGAVTAGLANKDGVEIYVRIGTEPLEDKSFDVEPAFESMNGLGVFALGLKELR